MHAGQALIGLPNVRHIGQIQHRIHAVGKHIHGKGHDIYITGALSVSKQRSLDTVCSCQNSKLCITDATASVVVGMQA